MPKHQLNRTSKYTAKQMYEMAADVSSYHEFLPLVHESEVFDIVETTNGISRFKGRMLVKKESLNISETFVSEVVANANVLTIVSTASEGPVTNLTNAWKFVDLPGGGSKSELVLEYEVRNFALRLIIKASSAIFMDKLTEAFEKRADKLYG